MTNIGSDERSQAIRDVAFAWAESTGNEILLLVEAGSRAHGFASPNSDHDVRVIFRQPLTRAMALLPGDETVDLKHAKLPFDPGFEVSLAGWSLRRALELGLASAPQFSAAARLTREARPHCAYFADDDFLRRIGPLAAAMAPRPAAHNLRGQLKVALKRELARPEDPKQKIYLQIAQVLLQAEWVVSNHERGWQFPLGMDELMQEVPMASLERRIIEDLLDWKRASPDSQARRRIHALDSWLATSHELLNERIAQIPDAYIAPEIAESIWLTSYGLTEPDLEMAPAP
ncbi:nucleotidyltransferase domain-containing protein [Paracoccus litorisediminis]|uniref:DNA polymerase beta superfamily protein n=1 Tax=Paracoccus litorisediminis TaxID=2006130 RepID=UPI0037302EE3